MPNVMPPDVPPPDDADYAGARKQVAKTNVVDTMPVAFYGTDLPIPNHLLERALTPEINKAVAAVLAESDDTVPKRGWNDFHKYWYATADDIRFHVAKILGKHGLSYEQHEVGYTPFGSLIAVHYYFVLVHQSGETGPPQRVSVLTQMISNKGAPDDKAFSKATVLALKDWTKGRFSIATGDMADDPDHDAAPPPQTRPSAPPRPPAKATNPAFHNAGLSPPLKPETNGHDPQSYVAETGELADGWLETVLNAMTDEPPGPGWVKIVRAALREAPSMDAITAIVGSMTGDHDLQKARPATQTLIHGEILAARKRISETLFPGDMPNETPADAPNHAG